MSTSSPAPQTPAAAGPPGAPGTDVWRTTGLALLGMWAALLGLAVALWARVALFPGDGDDVQGYIRWFGVPFVLLALGLMWWVWRSARDLRRGRREGWTLLLVLGGVAVVQSVITARPLLAPAGPGATEASAPPRELAAGLVAGIVLGLVSLTVALLGRRRPPHSAKDGGAGAGDVNAAS